jgi:hypothetical protein
VKNELSASLAEQKEPLELYQLLEFAQVEWKLNDGELSDLSRMARMYAQNVYESRTGEKFSPLASLAEGGEQEALETFSSGEGEVK